MLLHTDCIELKINKNQNQNSKPKTPARKELQSLLECNINISQQNIQVFGKFSKKDFIIFLPCSDIIS